MPQGREWEKEYRKPRLVTKGDTPQADTLKFLKFAKKRGVDIGSARVLDIGSGAGRNGNYLAALGAVVVGLEISETAISLAREGARAAETHADYFKHDIGSPYPLDDQSFDVALDVMSSNSLSEDEREIYIREMNRVLRPGGLAYVKSLCKDGDANAKRMLKDHRGPEKDTYVIPGWGLIERVWSREDLESSYSRFFEILHLEKKTNYARYDNRTYKRNYWIAYLRK